MHSITEIFFLEKFWSQCDVWEIKISSFIEISPSLNIFELYGRKFYHDHCILLYGRIL